MEFLAVKGILNRPGNIVLSSFSGTMNSLVSLSTINPYDTAKLTEALREKYLEDKKTRIVKNQTDLRNLQKHSLISWVNSWIADLKRADNLSARTIIKRDGIGPTLRLLKIRRDFDHYEKIVRQVAKRAYCRARNRLFILDNEGTLVTEDPYKGEPGFSLSGKLAPECAIVLHILCEDPHNTVCVVSGREYDHMIRKFQGIQGLRIGAESGYNYCWDVAKKSPPQKLADITEWTWKSTALNAMKELTEKIEGSFITVKESSVSWNYKNVDPDFGGREANELINHLQIIMSYLPVEYVHCEMRVEVRPFGVNKGHFSKMLAQKVFEEKKTPIDFLMCIGDSPTDEEMYKIIKDLPESICRAVKIIPNK